MFVSPVTSPMHPSSQLSAQGVWVPPGKWIEWYSGTTLTGPQVQLRNFSLSEIPVYVREGAIIPYNPSSYMSLFGSAQNQPEALGLMVFPGPKGTTNVYDDAGDSVNYDEEYSWTRVNYQQTSDKTLRLQIEPTEGEYTGMPKAISYEIKFMFSWPPSKVVANGVTVNYTANMEKSTTGWSYEGTTQTIIVNLAEKYSRNAVLTIDVTLALPASSASFSGLTQKMARAQTVKVLLDQQWGKKIWQEDYEALVSLSTVGSSIGDIPAEAGEKVKNFLNLYTKATAQVSNLKLDEDVHHLALAQLKNIV